MDRSIPVSSKLLQQKKKERDDEILYRKLKHIQNGHSQYYHRNIDAKSQLPAAKKKNNFIIDMRRKDIDRDNRILADKIKEAEQKTGVIGTIIHSRKESETRDKNSSMASIKETRRRDQMKICMENLYQAERLQSMKSIYRIENLEGHNLKRREILGLRCEYPVIIEKSFTVTKTDKNVDSSDSEECFEQAWSFWKQDHCWRNFFQ